MISKQDLIRFADGCELESMTSVLVVATNGRKVCPYIAYDVGKETTLAAALYKVASNNPDLKWVLMKAVQHFQKNKPIKTQKR